MAEQLRVFPELVFAGGEGGEGDGGGGGHGLFVDGGVAVEKEDREFGDVG